MAEEKYVHNEVTLTCTNGFKTAKLMVQDRGVKIGGNKLMATEEDKPTNFACKWAGVLAAIVAALVIAAPFIVAVLAAFVIGMAVSLSLGQLLCWAALQGSKWEEVHPKVKIKGKKALIENSKLKCGIFGGNIQMFYNEAVAQQQNRINMLNNTIEIFGAAFIGRGFRMFGNMVATNGWATALKAFGLGMGKSAVIGFVANEGIEAGTEGLMVVTNDDYQFDYSPFSSNEGDTSEESWVEEYYPVPFTDPLFSPGEGTTYTHGDKMKGINMGRQQSKATPRLDEYETRQTQKYKDNNPVHRYRRGRRSPHYGRQHKALHQRNRRAGRHGSQSRNRIADRYKSRMANSAAGNYQKISHGILAGFLAGQFITTYMEKKQEHELSLLGNPEEVSKSKIKVYADER